MHKRPMLLLCLVATFACGDETTIPASVDRGPVPTTPPCFGDLRDPDFTESLDPAGAPLTRGEKSDPDVQLHVGGMSGPQRLNVVAAYGAGLPEQEFACRSVAVTLRVRGEGATSCIVKEATVKGIWDAREGCAIDDATVELDEPVMTQLRVIGRATGLGLYNITEGRLVTLTVEPAE